MPCLSTHVLGNAFGANRFGFAFALNGLYPKHVAHARLPRQIVNRALLAVPNEEELDQLLRTSPVAFGFCINGVFFTQAQHMLNYEVGPNLKRHNANYVSKCRIFNEEQKENQAAGTLITNYRISEGHCQFLLLALDDCKVVFNYLVHYNHYERLKHLIVEQKSLDSTYSRAKRGREIGELFTVDDAMNLLGDQENSAFPIFRVSSETDVNNLTLCTAHFDFYTWKLFVYEDNPKEQLPPALIYNLVDLFDEDGTSKDGDELI